MSIALALFAAVALAQAGGQGLSAVEKGIVESARSRYYNLESNGFVSMTCSVNFDFSAVPILPLDDPEANLRLLKSTQFTIALDRNGPTVHYKYPDGTGIDAQRRAGPTTNLLVSLVQGLFMTWPTKGVRGPIPSFDSQIESVRSTNDGYRLTLSVPGGPVRVDLNKDYLVTEIVSVDGKIDERPEYTPTPDGLIFVGNTAVDNTQPTGPVNVKYELGNTIIDGLRLPNSARVQVNSNIDARLALDKCTVSKGIVISVRPPLALDSPK